MAANELDEYQTYLAYRLGHSPMGSGDTARSYLAANFGKDEAKHISEVLSREELKAKIDAKCGAPLQQKPESTANTPIIGELGKNLTAANSVRDPIHHYRVT